MSAQRLSASNLETPIRGCGLRGDLESAQRLSASNLETLRLLAFAPTMLLLLNAYRHLILKHTYRQPVMATQLTAQRLSASNLETQGCLEEIFSCSVTAQRLSASNLETQRSLDPLINMNSQSILQAPVESMQ